MPKRLMDCIHKVMKSGKSESEAWAICRASTGLGPHKTAQYIDGRSIEDWEEEIRRKRVEDYVKSVQPSPEDAEFNRGWQEGQRKIREQREKAEAFEQAKEKDAKGKQREEERIQQDQKEVFELAKQYSSLPREVKMQISGLLFGGRWIANMTVNEIMEQYKKSPKETQEKVRQLLSKKKGRWSMFTKAQITDLVAMADQLDAVGLHKEAGEIDALLKEAGIGDWLKGVWQAIKGNPQAHDKYVQIFNGMKKATTDIRVAFSNAEQTLKNLERFVTKPDLTNLKRWSDLAAQFQDKIEITLKNARSVAQQHQAFEEFSKSIFQSGGEYGEATPTAQPGTPGKPGAGGLTAPDLIEKYKTATPEVKEQIIKLLSGKAPKTPDMEDTQLIEPIKPGEAVQPGGEV